MSGDQVRRDRGHHRAGACVCISGSTNRRDYADEGWAWQGEMSTSLVLPFCFSVRKASGSFTWPLGWDKGLRHIAGWKWSHSSIPQGSPLPLAPSLFISTGFSNFEFRRKKV